MQNVAANWRLQWCVCATAPLRCDSLALSCVRSRVVYTLALNRHALSRKFRKTTQTACCCCCFWLMLLFLLVHLSRRKTNKQQPNELNSKMTLKMLSVACELILFGWIDRHVAVCFRSCSLIICSCRVCSPEWLSSAQRIALAASVSFVICLFRCNILVLLGVDSRGRGKRSSYAQSILLVFFLFTHNSHTHILNTQHVYCAWFKYYNVIYVTWWPTAVNSKKYNRNVVVVNYFSVVSCSTLYVVFRLRHGWRWTTPHINSLLLLKTVYDWPRLNYIHIFYQTHGHTIWADLNDTQKKTFCLFRFNRTAVDLNLSTNFREHFLDHGSTTPAAVILWSRRRQ